MNTKIPTSGDVRGRLAGLSHARLQELAATSGIPFTTLWKIRSGETSDPRIETVRGIYRAIGKIEAKANRAKK